MHCALSRQQQSVHIVLFVLSYKYCHVPHFLCCGQHFYADRRETAANKRSAVLAKQRCGPLQYSEVCREQSASRRACCQLVQRPASVHYGVSAQACCYTGAFLLPETQHFTMWAVNDKVTAIFCYLCCYKQVLCKK